MSAALTPGKQLRLWRTRREMTQAELARKIRVSRKTIIRAEFGARVRAKAQHAVAAATGITLPIQHTRSTHACSISYWQVAEANHAGHGRLIQRAGGMPPDVYDPPAYGATAYLSSGGDVGYGVHDYGGQL